MNRSEGGGEVIKALNSTSREQTVAVMEAVW